MHDSPAPVNPLPPSFAVILNLDRIEGPGTHWVAIFRNKAADPLTYYYDSFGLPPSPEIIKRYNVRAYNNTRHQSTQSDSCGLFALKILQLTMKEGKRGEEAFKYFSPNVDSLENERLLHRLMDTNKLTGA